MSSGKGLHTSGLEVGGGIEHGESLGTPKRKLASTSMLLTLSRSPNASSRASSRSKIGSSRSSSSPSKVGPPLDKLGEMGEGGRYVYWSTELFNDPS